MRSLLQDLRYGVRMLRRAPGFTTVAALTLALGIGANAAMFGVVDSLLFRPPPAVADPERLVAVAMEMPVRPGEPPVLARILSYPDFETLRESVRGFAGVAAYARTSLSVGRGSDARNLPAVLASGEYFRTLGVRAARGRVLLPDDDRDNAPAPVAVVSWEYWQQALGGDPTAIGGTIEVNQQPFTIVGVAPRNFVGVELGEPALWLPLGNAARLGYDAQMMGSRFAQWLSVVARLAPNVSRAQARSAAQAALLAARESGRDDSPLPMRGGGVPAGEVRVQIGGPGAGAGAGPPPPRRVELASVAGAGGPGIPLAPEGRQPIPVSLWFLAVTAAVLLIACANVANLLLARSASRSHEIAVRLSLGASRWRIARQLATESLLLAALGGVAGLVLAAWIVALLPRVIPLPPLPPFLDVRVLAFTAALTLVTTVVFGFAPAVGAMRTQLQRVLAASGRMRAGRTLGRDALVVVQLAASLVLLVGGGLFVRSLRNVRAIDVGFAAEELLVVGVERRGDDRPREEVEAFWDRALERVRALPGVRSAALGMATPFAMTIMMPVTSPTAAATDESPRAARLDFVGDGYFATLGVPVLEGRALDANDRRGAPPVAVVSRTLARQVWGGASPLGQCIGGGMGSQLQCVEVVGVVGDARFGDITADPEPMFYRPLAQRSERAPPTTVLHVRAQGDPGGIAADVRAALQALDPSIPFVAVRPVPELIRPQIEPWRVGTILFALLGGLGMTLAAVGLYGVLSYIVASRTRELGVRIALGATGSDVLALVLRQGGRIILIGVAVGIAAAAVATRLFRSMMYGVSPLDPLVYGAVVLLLIAVGLLAVYAPARRATRVDPIVALRAE